MNFSLKERISLLGLMAAVLISGCGGSSDKSEPAVSRLKAGAAKKDITPSFEPYTDSNGNNVWDEGEPFEDKNGDGKLDTLWVGGFSERQPTGVHDPLWVRAAAFSFDGELFVFAAVDTVGLSMKRIEDMKAAAAQALAPSITLNPSHCFIASTHTHQGPDTQGVSGPSLVPAWDENYLRLIVERGAQAIIEAAQSLKPAELTIANNERPNLVRDIVPPKIIDPYIGIMKFTDKETKAAIATLATISNHPEAAWGDNTLISSDFPHFMREKIEKTIGGMALYFSADQGLMQTPVDATEIGFEGKRCQVIGEAYADAVIEALSSAKPAKEEDLKPAFGFKYVQAPLQNFELWLAVKGNVAEGYLDYLYDTEEPPCNDLACIDVPVAALRLGNLTTIFSIPGELTPELLIGGIVQPPDYKGPYPDAAPEPAIKDHLITKDRFVIGLCGASIGYLFPKMTYDPKTYFDQSHGAGPDTASFFLKGLNGLLDEINSK